MYLKEDLEKMEISQLMEIAHEVGVKVSPDDSLESVIYAILLRSLWLTPNANTHV